MFEPRATASPSLQAGQRGRSAITGAPRPPHAPALPEQTVAVLFVGNRLSLDDGVAPAAYDLIMDRFEPTGGAHLFDVGCLSMDMVSLFERFDAVLVVDAVDGTGKPAGTIVRYQPSDIARTGRAYASLHDLKLADLMNAVLLLGYTATCSCIGMQVADAEPDRMSEDLTPKVRAALPRLVETVAAELARLNAPLRDKTTGELWTKGGTTH